MNILGKIILCVVGAAFAIGCWLLYLVVSCCSWQLVLAVAVAVVAVGAYALREGACSQNQSSNAQFVAQNILGKGGFGVVYKTRAKNGSEFAFKFIISPSTMETKRETIPLQLKHKNIIRIFGVWQINTRNNKTICIPKDVDMPVVAIQLELCDKTLRDELYKGNKARVAKWKYATYRQILDGVEYLHKNDIVHRDLKPENILFKADVVKITDFGLAKEGVLSKLYAHTGRGTPTYWAPELRNGDLSNKKSDVFSLGIIWAEFWVAGERNITRGRFLSWADKLPILFTEDQNVPQEIQDMIRKMTERHPNDRFSISQSKLEFGKIADFVSYGALMVAKSQSIINQIRINYPRISELLEYNRRGTIGFLKANGALQGYTIKHCFNVPYTGHDDGVKVWADYRTEIENYVAKLCKELRTKDNTSLYEELREARKTLAEQIHDEYFNKLPRWPSVGCENKEKIELNITSYYQSGARDLVWSCIGFITIIDRRPEFGTFMAEFSGEPEIKVLVIDHDKLKQLERIIINRSLEDAKTMIDEKERQRNQESLAWESLR